jgi:hypothetical protein
LNRRGKDIPFIVLIPRYVSWWKINNIFEDAPNGRATKMSIHLPATSLDLVEDGSEPESNSEESNAEDTWSDWVSDSGRRCKSLFEDKLLASVTEALDYDKRTYGFDLDSFCKEKGG